MLNKSNRLKCKTCVYLMSISNQSPCYTCKESSNYLKPENTVIKSEKLNNCAKENKSTSQDLGISLLMLGLFD